MEPWQARPLRRNQERIDAIGYLLQDKHLLSDEANHQLAHDLGELEDVALVLPDLFDSLRLALERLESSPTGCHDRFNELHGWFEEFRMHMQSAEPLIDRICNEIIRRNPDQFPWAQDETSDSDGG